MNRISSVRATALLTFVLPLVLSLTLSGCVLLGLGAAAVGGCALLDRDNNNEVTQAELSAGLFDAWDSNNDDSLTEAEFEAGIDRRSVFAEWSGDFDAWDINDSGTVSETEFQTGVARSDTSGWADSKCDDLGL